MNRTIHIYPKDYFTDKPFQSVASGLFCVKTDHVIKNGHSHANVTKYTFSLLHLNQNDISFYLAEAFPISETDSGLAREICEDMAKFMRYKRIDRLALINGTAPRYEFQLEQPSKVILKDGFVKLQEVPQSVIDQIRARLGLCIIPEEDFWKVLKREEKKDEEPPFVGCYI